MDKAGIIGVDIGSTNFRIGTVHADETKCVVGGAIYAKERGLE